MQYPSDDMDELFRQAAEEYPLNTRSADWAKLRSRLSDTEPEPQPKDRPVVFWVLLLLLFTFVGKEISDGFKPQVLPVTATVAPPVRDEHRSANGPADRQTAQHHTQTTGRGATRGRTVVPEQEKSTAPMLSRQADRTLSNRVAADKEAPLATRTVTAVPNLKVVPATKSTENPAVSDNPATFVENATAGMNKSPLANDTSIETKVPELAAAKQQPASKKPWYVGVVAGPDLSMIKFQKFSQVGFQAGVLVGYAVSSRIALEAGALTGKKFYYSRGEYIKSDYSSPYAKIVAVSGNCRMIELPVSLRYTFLQKEKKALFGTAGVSSYLMSSEDYTYDYLYLPAGNIVPHRRTYDNAPQNWLSVLQVSAGYTFPAGSLGNFRIEPYYAAPLKRMGSGKLPISSVGIRFGLTSRHF